MMNRRNMLSGSAAMLGAGGLIGCQAAPAVVASASAVEAAAVAETVATAMTAIANTLFVVTYAAGIISGKSTKVTLEALDAVAHGSEAVQGAAEVVRQHASVAQQGDSLLPLKTAKEDFSRAVVFAAPPVLPGSTRPEAWYWLYPVLTTPSGSYLGRGRLISAEELVSGPQTLWEPGFEPAGQAITVPAVYRPGFKLVSESDQRSLYGGGPVLHVFDDAAWNYPSILAQTEGAARPESMEVAAYALDPANDFDLKLRLFEQAGSPYQA